MTLVFQYGSNCLETEINSKDRLCGDAECVGIAETVDDFEIAFDVESIGRGCAAANMLRKPGGKTWGVLYTVPDSLIGRETAGALQRRSFDAIEGEGKNYKREIINVRCEDGSTVSALTYTVKNPKAGLKTDISYVRSIIHGLRAHGAPNEYVNKVKAIAKANNPDIAEEVEAL